MDAKFVQSRGSYYLYGFQIYDSENKLMRNFMPAMRDSDEVVGLYDTTTQKFYPPAQNSKTAFIGERWGNDRAGKKWTGLGGDNKMSNRFNWQGDIAPVAGEDLDFTIAVPNAEIVADIDATFGKIYLGAGDGPVFTGSLSVTSVNDATKIHGAVTIVAYYSWNGSGTSWSDAGVWTFNNTPIAWSDGVNAVFDIANATATLSADASANMVSFTQPATIDGSFTLTVPTVSVAEGVTATISAPTAGALEKTGAGMLTLGSSRADATTVTEGTLKMDGATVAGLTLGTNGCSLVTFDYGGQTLTKAPADYLVSGTEVALTNGTFTTSGEVVLKNGVLPSVLTIAKDASLVQGSSGTRRYSITKDTGTATINVVGGTLGRADAGNYNCFLQHASSAGRLNVNVSDGGSWNYSYNVYAMCYGSKGSTPSLYMTLNDSSLYVGNSFHFGHNETTSTDPTGVLAATNSVINIGNEFLIGRGVKHSLTQGGYTADFDHCIVTAKTFNVYYDRQLNNTRFNGTRFVFKATGGTIGANDGESNWFTVGDDGLTLDTQAYSATLNANLGGFGAVTKVGAGTLTVQSNQTASAALNVNEGTLELIAGLSVSRPISVAIGAVLKFQGEASLASLALAADSTNDVAVVSPITLSGGLTLPESGVAALTFNGGAFPVGIYSLFAYTGAAAADGAKFAPDTNGETATWSVINGALTLTVGNPPNTWIGGATGNLSDLSSWSRGTVPGRGETAVVAAGSSAMLTVGASFSPDVIIIPERSADVTFSGENAITGLTAITNLSSSTCTFEVPVAFADKIDVYQTAYYYINSSGDSVLVDGGHVRFVGGVTGSGFAEGTTRRLDGAYTIPATANWIANTTDNVWALSGAMDAGGSSLTITNSSYEVPGTADTSLLFISDGCAFTTGVVRTQKRLSYRNFGEYVVTQELEVSLTSDIYISQRRDGTYKFEKLTLNDEGTGTGWKFCLANSTQKVGTKHVYIGEGGVNINAAANKTTALMCGFDDQSGSHDITHLHPWHADYEINGKGGSTRDLLIYRTTYLHTDDENGVARTVTLNGIADVRAALTIKGSGRFQVNSNGINGEANRIGGITVTDSATLAYASGADLGAGAVTVDENATMEVASGVNTFAGGLILNDGATLAFNFTQRAVTPRIAIADGKALMVNGEVKVKIPENSKWPTAGEKVLTTCGGFNAEDVTVSLADGAPKWAKSIGVNKEGNIVLTVRPKSTMIIVR